MEGEQADEVALPQPAAGLSRENQNATYLCLCLSNRLSMFLNIIPAVNESTYC